MAATRNYIVLETSEHVNSALRFWRFDAGMENGERAVKGEGDEAGEGHGGAEKNFSGNSVHRGIIGTWHEEVREGACVRVGERVGVSAVWPDDSDALWLTRTGFLTPTSLEYACAADGCASTEPLKAMPAHFDAAGLECTQHFATSKDGTKVPYFQIGAAELPMDGSRRGGARRRAATRWAWRRGRLGGAVSTALTLGGQRRTGAREARCGEHGCAGALVVARRRVLA
eukprot:5400667-Pleurochrysis_carterae.AAC.1